MYGYVYVYTRTHTHTHTHKHSQTHTHSHTQSLSLSLSLSLTHTHTYIYTYKLSFPHTHTLSLTHTQARARAITHTPNLSQAQLFSTYHGKQCSDHVVFMPIWMAKRLQDMNLALDADCELLSYGAYTRTSIQYCMCDNHHSVVLKGLTHTNMSIQII